MASLLFMYVLVQTGLAKTVSRFIQLSNPSTNPETLSAFGFWDYTLLNNEGFPMFRQTVRSPSSGLMTLGEVWQLLHSSRIRQCVEGEVVIGWTDPEDG